MGNNQSYVERREDEQDVLGSGMFGGGNPAKPMIEIKDTNRIMISDKQAMLCNLVAMHHNVITAQCRTTSGKALFRAIGGTNHGDVQTAQLTRDSMSREDYIKVAIGQKKKQGLLGSLFSRKRSSNEEGENEIADD